MAFPNGMKVLEQCRISPAPCSVSRMSIPLTWFDMIWLTLPPVQRLLFYKLDCSNASFTQTILPNLKTSLSLTLAHFLPMAGYLTWPLDSSKPEILYLEGDSVSLTVCESDHDFGMLVGNHVRNASEVFYPLSPHLLNMSSKNHFPVLALQVTLFPNQGICIGISFHHTVADGSAFIKFVKSWASVCHSQGDTSFLAKTPLCYDRSVVKEPKGIDMKLLEKFEKRGILSKEAFELARDHATPADQKVLATFVLGEYKIKRLKSWLSKEKGMEGLSTFVITSAYVWICWIKARMGSEDVMVGFCTLIDCRERLNPPIPDNYFGNCLTGGVAMRKTSDLVGKDGIWIATEAIRNSINNITQGNDKIFKSMETVISQMSSVIPDKVLSVAGSIRFGVYEIDFGWGNPLKTQVASIVNTGAVYFSECPTEVGAVQISLALNPIEMEAFTSFFANTIEVIS